MDAWVIKQFGGPEVFERVTLPTPQPGPGQVRIKVAATSVNPVDYKIRSGAVPIAPAFPARLHGDVSGTIDAIGQGVERFAVGDRVYGCVGGVKGSQGALADDVIADEQLLAHAPKSIPLQDAAALPLVTLTAWEGLDKVRLGAAAPHRFNEPGSAAHVLVHGGTGGVGHAALQLAKARGARVSVTVSSDEKAAIAKKLGADETINYHEQTPEQYVQRLTDAKGFGAVFDTVGGENIPRCIEAAKLNGQIACIAGRASIDGQSLHMKGLSFHLVFMLIPLLYDLERARHGKILQHAAQLVDAGKLKPLIDDKRFTFDQISDAHAYAESGKQVGKVRVVHHE